MSPRMKLMLGGTLAVVALGGGLGVVNFAMDDTKVNRYAIDGAVREIVVKSDGGDVDFVRSRAGVRVRETRHFVSRQPKLDRTLKGGVLTLDSRCGGGVLRCYADLRVTVPAGVKLSVEADSGDVHAEDVDVREAHIASDSGDIGLELAGRQSHVWAHTDSGDVDTRVASARAVDAWTDSGDVDVTVPGGDYAVDAGTDSGDVNVDGITRNDHSHRSIKARTDSGDVTLRAR